jgi:hypothetical protein
MMFRKKMKKKKEWYNRGGVHVDVSACITLHENIHVYSGLPLRDASVRMRG